MNRLFGCNIVSLVRHSRVKMKLLIALAFVSTVAGEKWWLHKAPKLPGPKTLEVVHFFTLYQDQTPTINFAGEITFDREIKSSGK